ncbi:MAG: GNAT family N-acetyltransferase [Bacillota bacterium]
MTHGPEIRFRPLELGDLPLLHRWLNETPVVKQFYAHGEALSHEQILAKYGPRIRGEQPTRSFLILCDGVEIGYIQTYLWRDYGDLPRSQGLDEEAAGLDLFIGHPAYLHRGLGRQIMRSFLQGVVFADPVVQSCVLLAEVANAGALRAYEKAGFQGLRVLPDLPDEPGPVWLLRIGREEALALK